MSLGSYAMLAQSLAHSVLAYNRYTAIVTPEKFKDVRPGVVSSCCVLFQLWSSRNQAIILAATVLVVLPGWLFRTSLSITVLRTQEGREANAVLNVTWKSVHRHLRT